MSSRVLAVFVLGLCTVGATAPPRHRSGARTVTITIERMQFQPQSADLHVGDTVVWVNKDLVPHTATSKMGGFDSTSIQANTSWKSRVQKTGTYTYACTFHPTMTGTLRVK